MASNGNDGKAGGHPHESYVGLAHLEGNDNREFLNHEVPLPEDAYGAAIFAFIYDARELLSGRDHDSKPFWLNMYRLAYVMAVLGVNYMFQFLMLYWIFNFIVQPSVHSVQHVYQRFHAEFFSTDGEFLQEVWHSRDTQDDQIYKDQLCHMVFSKFYFLSAVLMMWVMIMVIEFRRNSKLLQDLCRVPNCPSDHPEQMVKGTGGGFEETDADDEKLLVQGLTPAVRTTVVVLIVLPKFVIGTILMLMGMIWLSATESFSELILNSLALEFVITIDDRLFEALLPESYREDMTRVVLQIPRQRQTLEESVREDWGFWKTSTFFLVAIPSFVLIYLKFAQFVPILGVLPFFKDDIQQACGDYLEVHKQRLCSSGFGEAQCFAFGGWKISGISSRMDPQ